MITYEHASRGRAYRKRRESVQVRCVSVHSNTRSRPRDLYSTDGLRARSAMVASAVWRRVVGQGHVDFGKLTGTERTSHCLTSFRAHRRKNDFQVRSCFAYSQCCSELNNSRRARAWRTATKSNGRIKYDLYCLRRARAPTAAGLTNQLHESGN